MPNCLPACAVTWETIMERLNPIKTFITSYLQGLKYKSAEGGAKLGANAFIRLVKHEVSFTLYTVVPHVFILMIALHRLVCLST